MYLNAYYFRAHMYTLVPRHVREDMEWMVSIGTRGVSIGILEQDLHAAVENICCITEEARRVGMEVWAVPARWGGLVAGCPKVPSTFASTHPETWMCGEDGAPLFNEVHGPMCSVHHPATLSFFKESISRLLAIAPFTGIVWDEPKTFNTHDWHLARHGGPPPTSTSHQQATASFFDTVTAYAKSVSPGLRAALFLYATLQGTLLDVAAGIPSLDDFGCDGRPWCREDGGGCDSDPTAPASKVLLDDALRFAQVAASHKKRSLMLIENHALRNADLPLLDQRLPDVLSLGIGHVLYYYYPRSVEDPDAAMVILGRHLKHAVDKDKSPVQPSPENEVNG